MASISSDSYFTGVFAGVAADAPPEKTRARGALETRGILVGEGESRTRKNSNFFFFLGSQVLLWAFDVAIRICSWLSGRRCEVNKHPENHGTNARLNRGASALQ